MKEPKKTKLINLNDKGNQLKKNESTLSKTDRYLKKHYPETHFNVVTGEPIFDEGKTFNDVITELKINGININVKDFGLYLDSQYVRAFDPFKEYFEGLEYKDDQDYIEALSGHVKTTNQELFNVMFKKHLVRVVGQSFGEKTNRFCLVLLSPKEYLGKSEFIRFLEPFNHQYYGERIDKDIELSLCKKFIISIEEIQFMNYNGVNHLKAVLSTSTVNIRKFYSQAFITAKRRCSFFASTNDLEFLGGGDNTRWIIHEVDDIDFSYNDFNSKVKKINIDDVWAQAYHLYKSDFNSDLTQEELEFLKVKNEDHKFLNNEAEWVNSKFQKSEEHFGNATDVSHYLRINFSMILNAQRVGSALTSLGFKKTAQNGKRGYYIEDINGRSIMDAYTAKSFQQDEDDKVPF